MQGWSLVLAGFGNLPGEMAFHEVRDAKSYPLIASTRCAASSLPMLPHTLGAGTSLLLHGQAAGCWTVCLSRPPAPRPSLLALSRRLGLGLSSGASLVMPCLVLPSPSACAPMPGQQEQGVPFRVEGLRLPQLWVRARV